MGATAPAEGVTVTATPRTGWALPPWCARLGTYLLPPPPPVLRDYAADPWDAWLVRGNAWLAEHVYRHLPPALVGGGRATRARLVLLLGVLAAWLAANLVMLHVDRYAATTEFGKPTDVDCYSSFWLYKDGCGLDGEDCAPFANRSLLFKCPGTCASSALSYPRLFANTTVGFGAQLVVGDNRVGYRGDSWLCESAIHAGIISATAGGCGRVSLNGAARAFPSSSANGITSLAFEPAFPMSYTFEACASSHCQSITWGIYALNVVVLFLVVLLLRPSNPVLCAILAFLGFFTPPLITESKAGLEFLSSLFGEIFGAAGVSYAVYHLILRPSWPERTMTLHRLLYLLPPYWVGVTWGPVTDGSPLDRLTGGQVLRNPGALSLLVIGSLVLLVLVLYQALTVLRPARLLLPYLAGYVGGGLFLYLITLGPLMLHLHHYILALVLLPLTRFRTPLSLVGSSLLFALFLHGVGRYGFSSLLQTSAYLQSKAGVYDSLVPVFGNASTLGNVSWSLAPPSSQDVRALGYTGYSLLVNDVERYAGLATSVHLTQLLQLANASAAWSASTVYYVRVALTTQGDGALDYSSALTLWYPGGR